MLKELKKEQERITQIVQHMEQELVSLPHGALHSEKKHSTYQYYVDGKYVRKENRQYAEAVAKRDYYCKLIKMMSDLMKRLDKLISFYESEKLDSIYNKMNPGRRILLQTSIYQTREQMIAEFENRRKQQQNWKYPIETEIYTVRGEQVRSKSEKIIADEFYRFGVPYLYEPKLILQDKDRSVEFYPDFLTLNHRNRRKFVFEHLGRMDDEEYVALAIQKINLYEKNGYLIGKNLIITTETKATPLNVRILDQYIQEFLI